MSAATDGIVTRRRDAVVTIIIDHPPLNLVTKP